MLDYLWALKYWPQNFVPSAVIELSAHYRYVSGEDNLETGGSYLLQTIRRAG